MVTTPLPYRPSLSSSRPQDGEEEIAKNDLLTPPPPTSQPIVVMHLLSPRLSYSQGSNRSR